MTITSLSSAFVPHGPRAEMARRPGAPAPLPAPQASLGDPRGCCDSPRRSPLFRALMEALGNVVHSAQTAGAVPGTAAPAAPAAPVASGTAPVSEAAAGTPEATDPPASAAAPASPPETVDLEEAVMNFARALLMALRGGHPGDAGSCGEVHRHGHGHAYGHHRQGRESWGDPAQRVEQLGTQLGAGTSAVATTAAAPSTAAAATPPTPVGAAVPDPACATDPAPAGAPPASVVYVNLSINGRPPGSSSLTRTQQGLLDAFGTLQQALGGAAPDPAATLKAQLSAFLQSLAEKLRASEATAVDAAQPGTLLHVTA